MEIYNHSVIGGTFDNLHEGHKFFIRKAFERSEKVTIGLTSDNYTDRKSKGISSFEVRKKALIKFLESEDLEKDAKIVPIDDIYGITQNDKNIDAIFVTDDTFENAKKINQKRKENSLPKLVVVKVETLTDEEGKVISSTNIRHGNTDEFGNYYINFFNKKDRYSLLKNYREDFQKPFGRIEKNLKKDEFRNKFIIAIGDVVVFNLVSLGITPDVSVFDYLTQRQEVAEDIKKVLPKPNLVITNARGTINSVTALKMHDAIRNSYENKTYYAIRIIGEEDLLTIPAILFAPLNSVVIYGQKDIGAVIIDVNLERKKEIEKNYLSKIV